MNIKKEDIDKLIAAYHIYEQDAGCPNNLWIPEYGWIIRKGKPTKAGKRYYEERLRKLYDKKSN